MSSPPSVDLRKGLPDMIGQVPISVVLGCRMQMMRQRGRRHGSTAAVAEKEREKKAAAQQSCWEQQQDKLADAR